MKYISPKNQKDAGEPPAFPGVFGAYPSLLTTLRSTIKTDMKLTIEEVNGEIAECYAEAGMKGLE